MKAIASLLRVVAMVAVAATSARGAGPIDDLLALVPAESGATLVVEDLRGHSREIFHSTLAAGLRKLPSVEAWLASPRADDWRTSKAEIEASLGIPLAEIRDEILGDAVVLALAPPIDEPRGLLLTKVRDRKTLDRLIAAANRAETASGSLLEVRERREKASPTPYWHRHFAPGAKADEWYVVLGPDTFAWSNSESLVCEAIARHGRAGGANLAGLPGFRKVRDALPPRALVRLYVDPRYVERLGMPDAADPAAEAGKKALAAVTYAGISLRWADGPILDVHATLDPSRVEPSVRRWAARPPGEGDPLAAARASSLAAISADVDFGALGDLVAGWIPEAEMGRAKNAVGALDGLFLGKDVRREILPALGPGVLLAFYPTDRPDGLFSLAATVELKGGREVPAAIDNALRTVWSLAALVAPSGTSGVEFRDVSGFRVASFTGAEPSWSFGSRPGRLAFGSDPREVATALLADAPASEPKPLALLRSEFFPRARTFAVADLEAVHRHADGRRAALARRFSGGRGEPEAAARQDLDRALDLMGLFRGGFVAASGSRDASSFHATAGLVARRASR